jgi:hypothetical protein
MLFLPVGSGTAMNARASEIIWQFHAYAVHQKVSRLFGPRYIVDDFC